MAKIYSPRSELQALKSMCSKDQVISGILIGRLNQTHFHSPQAREVYTRILKFFQRKAEVPTFEVLRDDLGLSEDAREFLEIQVRGMRDKKEVDHLVDTLDKYRRTRVMYKTCKSIIESLTASSADIEELQEDLMKGLTEIQSRGAEEAEVVHIGKDGNARDIIKALLYEEDNNRVIPTGFDTHDSRNGGFFRGALVGIAGTTGGGKSLIANQMAKNQASLGYKSILVPLEMSRDETLSRFLSGSAKMDSLNIFLKRLATGERDAIFKTFARLQKKIESVNGRYTVLKPKSDVSMEELLSMCHVYNPDIIYIDYLNLLSGVSDTDDSWKKLAGAARYAKVYAEAHNKVIVLLTQLSEEGMIRYSKGVQEHMNNLWSFVSSPELRNAGYINIVPLKSRNQDPFPFTLKANYQTMSVGDIPESELKKMQDVTSEIAAKKADAKPGGRKTSSFKSQPISQKPVRKEIAIEGL